MPRGPQRYPPPVASADRTRRSRSRRSRFPSASGAGRPRLPPRGLAALVGLACLGVSFYLYSGYRSQSHLRDAYQLGVHGRYAAAAAAASRITTAPARTGAVAVVAYAELDSGDLTGAAAAFVRAVTLAPRDWMLRADWAITLRRLGDRAKARQEMQVALSFNPLLTLPAGFCAASRRSGRRVVLC